MKFNVSDIEFDYNNDKLTFDEQIDHIEDVIVNHFGVEVYPEQTVELLSHKLLKTNLFAL